MARIRNEEAYNDARGKLLDVGVQLIRSGSYESVGINDVLREGKVPKGSFYHYFDSKEDFGLEVARHYHAQLLEGARAVLLDPDVAPLERLKTFFLNAYDDFAAREFSQGCLMCNLTTELADEAPAFQEVLQANWNDVSAALAACIAELDRAEIGLSHLTDAEAADWLLNSWSGALTRMKATRDGKPLRLFIKSTFQERK